MRVVNAVNNTTSAPIAATPELLIPPASLGLAVPLDGFGCLVAPGGTIIRFQFLDHVPLSLKPYLLKSYGSCRCRQP